ncbi:uncharacterized protein LOC135202961 [Macrobrachium nipponense]|uniref:uncharacterized protein LOC135202961 n=1 Tax=Macrobrachium nipponense TaxID=159736 RepID=UPI0030C83C12
MAETKLASQESLNGSKEMHSLEMNLDPGPPDSDSVTFGSFNDSQGGFYARRASESRVNHSVQESRSSTPTSGTDYQSCSNPSTPEKSRSSEKLDPPTATSEAVSNVKMSANIANKLSQMRVSMENLDDLSQSSFEEVDSLETQNCARHRDSFSGGGSPLASRKQSLKATLRQVFPYVSCLPFENNIVFCFVLSVWDNIVGPQTVYVWKRKSFPSQKTFDGLLDESEGIEIAEESVELEKARMRLKRMSKQLEGQESASSSGKENSKHDQKSHSKYKPRRMSGSSSHSENHSPSHSEKTSGPAGTKTSASRREQFFLRSKPRTSTPEMKIESGSFSNSNNDCVGSRVSVSPGDEVGFGNRTPPQASGFVEEESIDCKKSKAPSLVNFETTSVDSTSLYDSDGQELTGSWACGRSRLRMATVVRYVTEHSVAVGQVGLASEKITSSLLVVPHQGIIIVAARFTVVEDDCAVPYCLSMVVPLEEYDYFLPLTQPVTTWLITIAASTRLLITKHGLEGGGRVKSKLVELCDVLVALRSASLDQYPLTPAGRPPDDRRLAEIILTSHLQTLGSTVVVADSPNAANKVVMWIAQFSDPADLHISRLCLSYTQWPFHPGLSIQGIVRSANGEVNLTAQKLIQSSRPLTVVDINRGTVKQTGAPDVHARRNSSALHQELLSLWHDLPDVSAPSESLLEPVRGASSLVKKFLQDYDRLSSCDNSVRQTFIQAFLRSLQYTALAIITWTQQEWAIQRKRSGYGSLRRALCSIFDLDECDLRILLAQAELLQPGFYTYVMM